MRRLIHDEGKQTRKAYEGIHSPPFRSLQASHKAPVLLSFGLPPKFVYHRDMIYYLIASKEKNESTGDGGRERRLHGPPLAMVVVVSLGVIIDNSPNIDIYRYGYRY